MVATDLCSVIFPVAFVGVLIARVKKCQVPEVEEEDDVPHQVSFMSETTRFIPYFLKQE